MHPVLITFGPVTIYSFGVFALLGFLFASFTIWKRGVENHFQDEDIFDTLIILSLIGLFGARILYLVVNFQTFGDLLVNFFSIVNRPGFIFSGGLASGALGLYFICRRKRWEFFDTSDVFVTGLSLGQAIGWLGALFAGFGVGRETVRFGLKFIGYEIPRFPSQLLWFTGLLLIFSFLWRVENKYRLFDWYKGKRVAAQTGFLTFSYLIGYGVLYLLLVAFSGQAWLYCFGVSIEIIIGVIFLTIGLIGLYLRSGRALRADLGNLAAKLKLFIGKTVVLIKHKGCHCLRKVRRSRY